MPSSSSPKSLSSMAMVFFSSSSTPLFSTAWKPSSTSAYAGTCIFLILLAASFRALLAVKAVLEHRWLDTTLNRRYIAIAGKKTAGQKITEDEKVKETFLLSAQGVEEEVHVVRRQNRVTIPWRTTVDIPRAGIVTVITGVGYLL
jgi:hypothetical protein